MFAPRSTFDQLVSDSVTQTLVRFTPSPNRDQLLEAISNEALHQGASDVQLRADQPSNAALYEDVSGFGELSFLFPMLFLGAAGMATFILLGRIVRAERPQIASLRANGMGVRQIVMHYLGESLTVTMLAGTFGLVAGVAGGRLVTGVYTDAIDVPDTVTSFHLTTIVAGVVLSALTGAVAATVPAMTAAKTPPAAALRGNTPTGAGGRSIVERLAPPLRRLPARWRMVLRGITRDRGRSFSTAMGVVLALTLVLASWGMVDTVDILLDRQFDQVQRQDAQVYFDPGFGDVPAMISAMEGVQRVETVLQADVTLNNAGRRYSTELVAFEPETQMHDFDPVGSPGDGVVAGRSLHGLLDVDVGDSVVVTVSESGAEFELPIVGFVDEPLGTFVYTTLPTLARLDPGRDPTSAMVTYSETVDREVMRRALDRGTRCRGVCRFPCPLRHRPELPVALLRLRRGDARLRRCHGVRTHLQHRDRQHLREVG